jgi:hypothetical protein
MFKKLIVTGAAAGLLLVSAGGAFAVYNPWVPAPLPTTTVTNFGSVRNVSVNGANTGLNKSTGFFSSVNTGSAAAFQNTSNVVQTTADCGCVAGGNKTVTNFGGITNLSVNVANTGANLGGSIHTGGAVAGQVVTNVVNTSVGSSAN